MGKHTERHPGSRCVFSSSSRRAIPICTRFPRVRRSRRYGTPRLSATRRDSPWDPPTTIATFFSHRAPRRGERTSARSAVSGREPRGGSLLEGGRAQCARRFVAVAPGHGARAGARHRALVAPRGRREDLGAGAYVGLWESVHMALVLVLRAEGARGGEIRAIVAVEGGLGRGRGGADAWGIVGVRGVGRAVVCGRVGLDLRGWSAARGIAVVAVVPAHV